MLPDAQRVCHDRQRGIDRAAGDEETAVDDVKIVEIVRLAVGVERRLVFGSLPKRTVPVLVGDTGQWNALADEQIAREQALVTIVAMNAHLRCASSALSI